MDFLVVTAAISLKGGDGAEAALIAFRFRSCNSRFPAGANMSAAGDAVKSSRLRLYSPLFKLEKRTKRSELNFVN